jgi:hypothetical protein
MMGAMPREDVMTEPEPTIAEIEAAAEYLGEEGRKPRAVGDDLAPLYVRVALLLRALAPFVEESAKIPDRVPDGCGIGWCGSENITVGHLRRARRIVRGEG